MGPKSQWLLRSREYLRRPLPPWGTRGQRTNTKTSAGHGAWNQCWSVQPEMRATQVWKRQPALRVYTYMPLEEAAPGRTRKRTSQSASPLLNLSLNFQDRSSHLTKQRESLPQMLDRQRSLFSLIALFLLSLFYLSHVHKFRNGLQSASHFKPPPMAPTRELQSATPTTPPSAPAESEGANATLGFGTIAAVSRTQSPRIKGLLWAANLTGIDITIPEQPVWTGADVRKFKAGNRSQITKGSAMAWMGHLNALKWFLSTSHQTALIVEDDVDWNVALRTSQIRRAEAAFRIVISSPASPSPVQNSDSDHWSPWRNWELLWLGHCGDKASPGHIISHSHLIYNDPTVPPHSHLEDMTSAFLHTLHVPEQSRIVHRSFWPLCTFAYAVTRASAQRILSTYGSGVASAYDVALLEACRDHNWSCYTVAPELFHHIEAPSEIANVDDGVREKEANSETEKAKQTHNIGCAARHVNMWVNEDDMKARRWKMDAVRSGHCFLHGTQEWID